MALDDCGMDLERNRRLLLDKLAAYQRDTQRHEERAAMFQLGMDIYCNAMLGPMYATLNPDPRVLPIAQKHADEMQAMALKFITDHC